MRAAQAGRADDECNYGHEQRYAEHEKEASRLEMGTRIAGALVREKCYLFSSQGTGGKSSSAAAGHAAEEAMGLPRSVVRIANAITNFAIITGIPRPPYTRKNALVVETVGRRSGAHHRIPVGYLDDGGRIIVVVEDGLRANWVRNALANHGRLRIHLRGHWREATLRVLEDAPESYLARMNRVHAGFVRLESSTPKVVELVPEPDDR